MKWVFVSVLLINVVYFAYNSFFNTEHAAQKQKIISRDKSQLILLKELDSAELKALQEKVSSISNNEQILTSNSETDKITPVLETDKTILNTEQIVKSKENINFVDKGTLTDYCFTLGPFTKILMDEIRLELEKEYNNQLSFAIETTSAVTYYRIYIPPLETKEKIKQTLVLLDKNNLKDHYVMSIDGRKNAIALGVFKKKKAAEKIAGRAKKLGLSTTIEAISKDKNSLYKLHIIFKISHDIQKYHDLIKQKNLKSIVCENKG